MCAGNLDFMIDNAIVLENVANKKTIKYNHESFKHKTYDSNLYIKNDFVEPLEFTNTKKHFSSNIDHLNYLFKKMNSLNSFYTKLEERVKKIEIHQRGCQVY